MRASIRILAAIVVAAAAFMAAAPVRAANILEMNFGLSGPRYDAVVPLCEDGAALGKIQSRFADKESTFWTSTLQIVGFQDVRETAFRPWHYAAIPRRFCSARAMINDGSVRPIYYSIGEDTGLLGITWGVEWCVVGLDRNWAYNPSCKMARP